MIVVIIIGLFAGLGGYAAYQNYLIDLSRSPAYYCITVAGTIPDVVNINCNAWSEKLLIIHNTTLNMLSNSSYLILTLNASNIRLELNIRGSYNHANVTYGKLASACPGTIT